MMAPSARLTCALAVVISACGGAPSLAIRDVTVIDVAAGIAVPHQTVVVEGGHIVRAGPIGATAIRHGTRVVDGTGMYLVPGLWDMHVHALWDSTVRRVFLPRFVAWGVTGIRDMGGTIPELQAARDEGDSLAPRIVAAGVILDGPEPVDPSVSWSIADSAQAVRAVDSLAALGADFAKVYTLLPRDAYFALARESAQRHLPFAGHLPAAITPLEAAAAGQRTIEHMREEIAPYCLPTHTEACTPILTAFRAAPVWQTPTLVVVRAKVYLAEAAARHSDLLEQMPAQVRAFWSASNTRNRDSSRYADVAWLTREAWRAGVPILGGTDTGVLYTYPGASLHDELVLLTQAGLSPAAALRSVTLEPARMMGATDSMGRIAPGNVADLVLLSANPLDDIHNTTAVVGVVLRGRFIDRAILDSLARVQ